MKDMLNRNSFFPELKRKILWVQGVKKYAYSKILIKVHLKP